MIEAVIAALLIAISTLSVLWRGEVNRRRRVSAALNAAIAGRDRAEGWWQASDARVCKLENTVSQLEARIAGFFPASPVFERVEEVVLELSTLPEATGEYKRHVALGRLVKEFPKVPPRDLSYMIELALR